MEKVKSIGIILIKVVIAIFLIISFNLLMMPKYINENQEGRIVPEMYREKVSPDVLFLGSSVVYSGVSPVALYEFYGMTSYDCSTSSQTSWNSYYILQEALDEFDPSLVVFDIGFLTAEDTYAEEVSNRKAYDYMKYSVNKYKGLKRAIDQSESKWSYLLPALRYHARYSDLGVDDIKYMYYKPDVTYNGFLMNKIMSPDIYDEEVWEAEDIELSEENKLYLEYIIKLCSDKGVNLMLMKTPSYQAKWGPAYENSIKKVADEHGLIYINFDDMSDVIGIDWANDSPDNGRHLNVYGAERFSYYLGGTLKTTFDIPDRREDTKYSDIWNDKVSRYENDKVK